MSTYGRVGVVTGANKGIGLAIIRQLALQYPKSPLNNGPFLICECCQKFIDSSFQTARMIPHASLTADLFYHELATYLTARDKGRGEAALKDLEQDAQLKQAKALKADGGLAEIKFHAFDVTDSSSVKTLAEHLKKTHGDGIDFIINNAGIAMDGFDANVVKTTLNCNYYSTLSACHAFIPLLKPTGRMVNVASTSGSLKKYSTAIRDRFLASKSERDVTSIMQEFQAAVEAGKEKDAGFPSAAYAVSKAGLIGGTRALADEVQGNGSKVLVNSCCPGYVNTDMSKGNGTKTPDEGAQTPVWLAIQDFGGKNGAFYRDEKEIEWQDL